MNAGVAPTVRSRLGLLGAFIRDPNAIWIREMRQSARAGRTPWLIFAATLLVSLTVCSLGGIVVSAHVSPAKVGLALSQVFFSLAWSVVALVGPVVAANSVAAEREGRTWEAILLTGMTPSEIARGKFVAAYTTIALYIAGLAPIAAVPFLFGGTTATEVILGFALLMLLAALAVAFGLAVSSMVSSLRAALVVTLLLSVLFSPILFSTFGFGFAAIAHKAWPDVPILPVWLPLAYTRAPFGIAYLVFLMAAPLTSIAIPAWFFYELTVANLSGTADDRSTGLKRWFVVAAIATTSFLVVAVLLVDRTDIDGAYGLVATMLFTFTLFAAFLFADEPLVASKRVRTHWARRRRTALTRWFGPGLGRTTTLVILITHASFTTLAAAALLRCMPYPGASQKALLSIVSFTGYGLGFSTFVTGLNSFLRSRNSSAWGVRIITIAVSMAIALLPWAVAAIAGVITQQDRAIAIAAPSFTFAPVVLSVRKAYTILPAIACFTGWWFIGLVLALFGARRARTAIAEQANMAAQLDASLAHASPPRAE